MDLSALMGQGQQSINAATQYGAGQELGANIRAKRIANQNAQYEQDMSRAMQRALQESVDPNTGIPDPDKLRDLGIKYGVAPQAIEYQIKTIPAIWKGAQETAQAKAQLALVSPKGAVELNQATGAQPAPGTKTGAEKQQQSEHTVAPPQPKATEKPSQKPMLATPEGLSEPVSTAPIADDSWSKDLGDLGETKITAESPVAPVAPKEAGFFTKQMQMEAGYPKLTSEAKTDSFKIDPNASDKTIDTALTKYAREGKIGDLKSLAKLTKAEKIEKINELQSADQLARLDTVGPEPLPLAGQDGKVDYNAYQQLHNTWIAKRAAVIAEARDQFGAEYATQLAQKLSLAGNERAEYSQGLVKQERQSIIDRGYDPAKITSEQARDLDSRRALLGETKKLLEASKDDLQGKNGPEAQYAAIVPLMNNWSIIENAGTQGGQEKLEKMFTNINANLGQAFRDGGIEGVKKAIPGFLISNPVDGYAAIKRAIEDAEKHGKLASDVQAASLVSKKGAPKPSDKPGASNKETAPAKDSRKSTKGR